MKLCRLAVIGSAVALTVPGSAWTAAAATNTTTTATTAPPRAQLVQFACQHALDPANRVVSIQAVMRPLTGTRRMAIRFDLLERVADSASWTAVHAGDLGTWRPPDNPTLGQLPGDVWRLSKSVYNLNVPASYQFRVSFRWTGAHGKLLGTVVRYSRSCRQRELRPDLVVNSITVSAIAGHPNRDLYTAVIANQGLTGAGPFEVLFVPGDTSAPTPKTIQYLGAGQTDQLSFEGPVCDSSSPPTVTADAASQIDDYNRANNTMTAVCPAPSSS